MRRRERRWPDDRFAGFTLLEVLVALTILGLILVALTNGVRFAGQAWERQERGAGKRGDTDAVQNILRTLIAGGAQLRPFPQPVMEACLKAANEVFAETGAANADFKKVFDNMVAFRNDGYLWWQVAEYTYDNFMIRTRPRG